MNTITKQFIDKLVKDKGEKEAQEFIKSLVEFNSATVMTAMLEALTEEDIEVIDKMTDEKAAVEEVNNRFKLRSGMTPTEFVATIQNAVAEDYLKTPSSS